MKKSKKSNQFSRFVREANEQITVMSPDVAGQYFLDHIFTPIEKFEQEEMWILLLNSRSKITHEVMVYRGTVASMQVRPAELLREAVRLNTPALILGHNHPSSDPTPSVDDLATTRRVIEAAKLLGIELYDHLIVIRNSWVSLRAEEYGLPFK